jgi:hypothetical protein
MKANHNIYLKHAAVKQLLQISVVQRMKANHNVLLTGCHTKKIVANISCLKNESKSQLASGVVGSGSVMIRTPDHYLKD